MRIEKQCCVLHVCACVCTLPHTTIRFNAKIPVCVHTAVFFSGNTISSKFYQTTQTHHIRHIPYTCKHTYRELSIKQNGKKGERERKIIHSVLKMEMYSHRTYQQAPHTHRFIPTNANSNVLNCLQTVSTFNPCIENYMGFI